MLRWYGMYADSRSFFLCTVSYDAAPSHSDLVSHVSEQSAVGAYAWMSCARSPSYAWKYLPAIASSPRQHCATHVLRNCEMSGASSAGTKDGIDDGSTFLDSVGTTTIDGSTACSSMLLSDGNRLRSSLQCVSGAHACDASTAQWSRDPRRRWGCRR